MTRARDAPAGGRSLARGLAPGTTPSTMKTRVVVRLIGALLLSAGPARGQGLGSSSNEPSAPSTRRPRMGDPPGAGANPLGSSPGAGEAVLEGQAGSPGPRIFNDPNSSLGPGLRPAEGPTARQPGASIAAPATSPINRATPFGSLALPSPAEDGPDDGLTLDQAIDRLVRGNLDLRSKSLEIPQAEADVLTASLRANPVLYSDVQCVPYGSFSLRRPGGQTQYDLNITYPLDLSRKRKARTLVAVRARRVLEAQYQDAVREEIDNLYTEFVDVLATRETVREARQAVEELATEPARPPNARPEDDLRLEVRRESAEIALAESEEQLKSDLRALGLVLGMTPDEAERLRVRGNLHDVAPPPALGDALLRLALATRPDLVAYRLGVHRAEADMQLALANRYPDLFLLYQPFTYQDDRPLRTRDAQSWGVGLGAPVPLFNRNQGNVRRAQLNVTQTQIELIDREKRVMMDVRQAERLYVVTRQAVERIERSLLPKAREEHDRVNKLYLAGKADELAFLTAEHDFDLVVRQYRDSLVRHRRAMLKLNTAVGQRILP